MIRVRGLAKRFGRNAVFAGIDLDVSAGERVALIGSNGSGKTTLMRCLMGLTSFEGVIELGSHHVHREGRAARARLGYVPQRAPRLSGSMADFVGFSTHLRGADPQRVRNALRALDLPLEVHGGKAMCAMSGGMLQKVLLALALGAEVPLLLLDEPTANLDSHARHEFLDALNRIEGDTTIVLATHRLGDLEAVADRLVVLHGGVVAFDGSKRGLWDRYAGDTTLWLTVPTASRPRALACLTPIAGGAPVRRDGSALGIRVPAQTRATVVHSLKQWGVPVTNLWTEAPTIDHLLRGATASGNGRSRGQPRDR